MRRLVSVAFTTGLFFSLLVAPVEAAPSQRLDVLIRFASAPTSADLALVRAHGRSVLRLEIMLTATSAKVRGAVEVELAWSGASAATVDVFRNGALMLTTMNDGSHLDSTGARGSGSFTYRICDAGTPTCSNAVTIAY